MRPRRRALVVPLVSALLGALAFYAASCGGSETDGNVVPCPSSPTAENLPHEGDRCDGESPACAPDCPATRGMQVPAVTCIGGRWRAGTAFCDSPCIAGGCDSGTSDARDGGSPDIGPCLVDPAWGVLWSCDDSTHARLYSVVDCSDPACGCGGRPCSGACDKTKSIVECAAGTHCVYGGPLVDGAKPPDEPCQPDVPDADAADGDGDGD